MQRALVLSLPPLIIFRLSVSFAASFLAPSSRNRCFTPLAPRKVSASLLGNTCAGSRAPPANMSVFGDDSFLDDLDVDAVVRQCDVERSAVVSAVPHRSQQSNEDDSKRRKLSLSPFVENRSPGAAAGSGNGEDAAVESLRKTCKEFFGFSSFRPGQLEVVKAVALQKRDAAVFWATGMGKSLTYQLPALHLNKTAVIISPLISLMQDQVQKLNYQGSGRIATFLGSAQQDASQIRGALAGEYNLVYVTPEKLSQSSFLDQLASLHSQKQQICLFAVDESHCVSEWGHDFRTEFRAVGSALRSHPVLRGVPILALTATAVPRVQEDVVTSLRLRGPLVARQSFDRHNLKIRVHKKLPGGLPVAMKDFVEELNSGEASQKSTILYAPTRAQVEEIATFLQASLDELSTVKVEAYHAGMSNEARAVAHTNFLTGTSSVMVATTAFGMGIDKPDIRRVIHYGCPKTLEEYYQQIGRAGRDGLPSECIMYVSESDFDRYKGDFYLGGLHGEALQATLASMKALRTFSFDSETCRRKALLTYFHETPSFGERCGTCDTCLSVATYGDDAQRDFAPLGARVVLQAISFLREQGLTTIEKVLGAKTVETYRYKNGMDPNWVQEAITLSKSKLSKKYPLTHFRELITPLVQKGYLSESMKTAVVNGYKRTWTVFSVPPKGMEALNSSSPILLPVPESVRKVEKQEIEKRERILAQLERNGIDRSTLPQEEIESGDGEVIRAYTKWYNYLESLRKSGRDDRVAELKSLLSAIEKWRSETAVKYRVAPASVMPEHLLVSIAYTTATMPAGIKMDAASLEAAGLRTRETVSLVTKLGGWVNMVQPAAASAKASSGAVMMLPEGELQGTKWYYAVYKPQKKTGLATWQLSYNRFARGESPQTIAMSPGDGKKPIQVGTVAGHLFDAVIHGRSVDVRRLAEVAPPPTKDEWERLKTAEMTTGMDAAGDPGTSGKDGESFKMTDFLRPIMGDQFADTPYTERSEPDREKFGLWCNRLKWYLAFRRIGYEPEFE